MINAVKQEGSTPMILGYRSDYMMHPLDIISVQSAILRSTTPIFPFLHLFTWKYPSISFVKMQSPIEVKAVFHNFNAQFYIKRNTYGKAIYHQDEIGLSLYLKKGEGSVQTDQLLSALSSWFLSMGIENRIPDGKRSRKHPNAILDASTPHFRQRDKYWQ